MNYLENNKLIAEFFGSNKKSTDHPAEWTSESYLEGKFWVSQKFMKFDEPDGNDLLCPSEMKFHNDWNWLIEVVERIESLGYWVEMLWGYGYLCNIGKFGIEDNLISTISETKIETVYNACVAFIEWYNNK